MDVALSTESPDELTGRWVRYVYEDPYTQRESIKVAQIILVDRVKSRPLDHNNLSKADKEYVEFLLTDNESAKLKRIDILAISPEHVAAHEDPIVIAEVKYSNLGKPEAEVEFSPATVTEVLNEINRVAIKHPEAIDDLIERYRLEKSEGGRLSFRRKAST